VSTLTAGTPILDRGSATKRFKRTRGPASRRQRIRYRYRLVVGMLLVLLPVLVVLALWLTARSSSSLTAASHAKAESLAHALELRVEDWVSERRSSIALLAGPTGLATVDPAALGPVLRDIQVAYEDFKVLAVVDLRGEVVASSSELSVDLAGAGWFDQLVSGESVLTSPLAVDGRVDWVVAEPVLGADGRPQGAVIGYLDTTVLARLLDAESEADRNALVVDRDGVLIYGTDMGEVADDAALLAAGGLASGFDSGALRHAADGDGSAQYTTPDGHEVIGGFGVVDDLGWTLVAQEHTSHSLELVHDQRVLARRLVAAGTVVAALAAWIFARTEARKLASFADETRVAGVEVNLAASELSASSDELASTTTQQSAAVTQASATTEELARASSAIADTVDEVARQTSETRDNLERAEHDIQLSSERTLALAGRVNEIGALLALINEIADQTGLLALNAAIEAARAGEDGRGFAVVADEVRRLADNSKRSAGDISRIIDSIHTETNATVMAMEKGAKQMQHGLTLLEHVTDATDQVRLTTQQQRSATAQVVETMVQLTDASRQVSITAQQIAGAAGNLAELAGNLELTAANVRDRY
jgi:methyl-accepting chemotaxis protein